MTDFLVILFACLFLGLFSYARGVNTARNEGWHEGCDVCRRARKHLSEPHKTSGPRGPLKERR